MYSRVLRFLALSLLAFVVPSARAVQLICDTSCGSSTTPSDTALVQARSSPTAARGFATAIRPVLQVSRTGAVVGSQSFTYAVPLFGFPGRAGMTENLHLTYNSFVWTASGFNGRSLTLNADFDTPSVGFRADFGWLQFSDDGSSGVLADGNGTKHPIGLVPLSPTANGYRTTDGTDIRFITGSNGTQIALYKSGLQVTYAPINTSTLSYRPILFEDANGNTISVTYQNNASTNVQSVVDSLGRTINYFYDSSSLLSCITTAANCTTPNDPLSGDSPETYRFDWNTSYVLRFNFSRPTGGLTSGTSTLAVLTGVTRPDGTSVHFDYGDWGIVNTVRELSKNGSLRYSTSYNFPAASAGALSDNPGYTQQTVFDGVNTGTWQFNVVRDATTHAVTSFAMTDPAGLTTTQTFSNGLPSQIVASAGALHTTVNSTWVNDAMGIPRLTNLTRILEDDQTRSATVVAYDADGNAADVKQFDYGNGAPGPLLKETIVAASSIGGNVTRPTDMQIKDGAGNVVYHRTFGYDESPLTVQSPNPAGHDAAFTATARGNLTSTTIYADPRTNSGGVTSRYTYDNLGNLLTSQDGCCTFARRTFSSATQYAFADSTLTGPSGKEITTGQFTYSLLRGTVTAATDVNGAVTRFTYDIDGRPRTVTTPDGVVSTTTYDDGSPLPTISASSTATPGSTQTVVGAFGPLTASVLDSHAAVVSTKAASYDAMGRVVSTSNPYGPADTPLLTQYTYDPLGRRLSTTPPALDAANPQNPYTSTYALNTVTITDPALKQSRQTSDAMGRLIRVDEPGTLGGAPATASLPVTGTERSVATGSGNGATPASASVTITPNSASDRSTSVRTHNATAATGTVTIGGQENATTFDPCSDQQPTFGGGGGVPSCPYTVWDSGSVSMTVNGVTQSVAYGQSSTPSSIAAALAATFSSNGTFNVTASGNVVTAHALTAGAGGNAITLSSASATNDFADFGGPSFSATASGAHLTGGTDDVFTTVYDTGTVRVSFTANGTQYSKSVTYGQTDTGSTLVQALQRAFSSDATMNALVTAGANANTLTLTTIATGAAANYPFAVSSVTTSPNFAAGSTSFTTSPSGSAFASGTDGVLYDSGTIQATLTGFNKAGVVVTAPFGQGSSPITVANSIAAAFANNPLAPVDASVAPNSATIVFTSKEKGADANGWTITLREISSQPAQFPTPSFPTSTATTSGGANGTASLDPSVALSTLYTYDPAGDLLTVAQGQQTRSYTYDGLSRMTSSRVPESGNAPVTYTWTDFGAPATRIEPRLVPNSSAHITTTHTYDDYNRPQGISYNDGTPGITYTYGLPNAANNGGGRLIRIVAAPVAPATGLSAAEDYQYDAMGRVTQCATTLQPIGSSTPAGSYTTRYTYNADGTVAALTYPSGRVISSAFDDVGRLTRILNNGNAMLDIGANYNAAGMVLHGTYGNGVQATYGYNNQLQLAALRYASPATTLLDLSYGYGGVQDNGQIASIGDNVVPAHGTAFTYDALGRLATAQTADPNAVDSWKLRYRYDRYGNRQWQAMVSGNASVPDQAAFIEPVSNHLLTLGLSYDAAGNMTADQNGHAYAFDAENRITSVDGAGGYAYGPAGRRVLENGTYFVYSGDKVIAEYTPGAAVTSPQAEYVYTGGRLLATITSALTTYHYPDHLSTRISVDTAGTVRRTFGHFPFGGTWYESSDSKWKFTTYEHDAASGLEYAQARFDSTFLGRFLSRDPLSGNVHDPQSLNGYTYVKNDPVNNVDPSGAASGNWLCLLDEHGDCVGGDYANSGLSFMQGINLWPDPFGPMVDPTKFDPLKEAEAEYDKRVAAAFAWNNFVKSLDAVRQALDILNKAFGSYLPIPDPGDIPKIDPTLGPPDWFKLPDPTFSLFNLKGDAPSQGNQKVGH